MQYVDGKHPVRVAFAKQRVTVPSHDLVAASPKQNRAWETRNIPNLHYVWHFRARFQTVARFELPAADKDVLRETRSLIPLSLLIIVNQLLDLNVLLP